MKRYKNITIALPEKILNLIQGLIDEGELENRSKTIRDSVQHFLDDEFNQFPDTFGKGLKVLTVNLSHDSIHKLEELIESGNYPSRSEAVRVAIRDFLKYILFIRETRKEANKNGKSN